MYNYFIDFLYLNYMPICKGKLSDKDQQQQRYKIEETLISLYDLRPSIDFHVFDIPVIWKGNEYTIHTFQGGNLNNTPLVLLHGYGGSNVHYSKTYKELCKTFRVISIDLPGMGFSSKANIKLDTADDCMNYFTVMIDLWRQEINLKTFCIAGHSFGGYIAALYAMEYPEYIEQLFLLSPAGCTFYTPEKIAEMNDFQSFNFLKRWALGKARDLWTNQVTPQSMGSRWYGNCLIGKYLNKRMKIEGKELEVWKQYKEAMVALPEGSEKSIFVLFDFPRVIPKKSIEVMFEQQKDKLIFPVVFYFGSHDWMDQQGAIILAEKFPSIIQVRIVQDAGHQLQFENPALLVQYIVEDYYSHKNQLKNQNFKIQLEEKDHHELQFANEI